jgi:membrane protein required for colicin V production
MPPMNAFDAAVYGLTIVAVVSGFRAGLLRSVAAIVGYAAAMPIALTTAPLVAPFLAGKTRAVWAEDSFLVVGLFLAIGILLGALLRAAIGEVAGDGIHVTDRLAGSLLGAVRVGLVAVTMVLIFDQLIPPEREPAFLRGSQLRPVLSAAGRIGLKSLPPDVTAYIDRLKRERRISS